MIKETHGKTEKETEKTRQSALDSGIFSGTCCFLLFRVQADRHLPGYKTGTDEYRDLQQYTTEITKTPETPAPTKTEEPQTESEPAEPSEPEPEPLSYPTEPPLAVDFESLKAINPDVKGWLYIEALDISYPVVQGPDNDAYLHTTYEGTSNFAGSIFLDYQNQGDFSDGNTIVYGHNMKNLSMFGKLKQMKEQEKYRDSVYFWMLTPGIKRCVPDFFCLLYGGRPVMSTRCIPAGVKRLYSI